MGFNSGFKGLKTPGNYVEVGFPGQICWPLFVHFRSSLPEGSHVA